MNAYIMRLSAYLIWISEALDHNSQDSIFSMAIASALFLLGRDEPIDISHDEIDGLYCERAHPTSFDHRN